MPNGRDDPELDRWMSEIRLRAIAQIGKISRELEKARLPNKGHGAGLPMGGKTKERATPCCRHFSSQPPIATSNWPPRRAIGPAAESAMENYFATTAVGRKGQPFGGIVQAIRNRPATPLHTPPDGL